ncbi:MAG: cell division protein FtsQ/DivIB [Xanthomonadales bacterium]|nr:cell division protein FtsQ/DivIB [Xanthomonadales bacterium]MDL1869173.1 FtsQ-type POTRA domain-containing protein [Gammaproteobacteria bacterium PRO6]
MNGLLKLAAWLLALVLVALPLVGVLQGWFATDSWPVTRLAVRAEFSHVSAEQIRAAAQPHLGQGFFAIRLGPLRDAIAQLPWVERVEARKRWPDTVDVVVYEQQPYAHWGSDRLINRHGGLFTVSAADAAALHGLPRLAGPDERIAEVLRFHAQCQREFAASGMAVNALELSPRGSWRIGLAAGTRIELGREQGAERLRRFLDVWPRLAGLRAQAPATIDLRYANGFAISWPAASDSGSGEPAPLPPTPADARARTRAAALAAATATPSIHPIAGLLP